MIRVCSIFSQLLQLFPRLEFESAVRQHKAERHARGFACWTQLIAMLFCHLGRAQSLREICGGLSACEGKLKHLGVEAAPRRSTLAYANEHRPWELFQTVFEQLLKRCQQVAYAQKRRFRFKNPVYSIDSTVIQLALSVFDWAHYQRQKGAAKLHLVLDHQGLLPSFAVITEGKGSDLTEGRKMQFPAGTMLVFDRGYQDYGWFERLTREGVFFVTRLRCHAHIEVLAELPVVPGSPIVRFQEVRIGSQKHRMQEKLRLIESLDPQTGKTVVLITNNFKLAASTLAQVYKDRWQIEVFFRALKQNLRVKTFVGTSPNAVHIQIWTALISILLLRYLQLNATFPWSLSNLVALLRQQLFVYRDLWTWINSPFEPPPGLSSAPEQLSLALAGS
ncbi:MAG: IS4 family transposase [Candidatus Sulfotelmatobacter sp.]